MVEWFLLNRVNVNRYGLAVDKADEPAVSVLTHPADTAPSGADGAAMRAELATHAAVGESAIEEGFLHGLVADGTDGEGAVVGQAPLIWLQSASPSDHAAGAFRRLLGQQLHGCPPSERQRCGSTTAAPTSRPSPGDLSWFPS